MFNWRKKELKAESIKEESPIELQKTSSQNNSTTESSETINIPGSSLDGAKIVPVTLNDMMNQPAISTTSTSESISVAVPPTEEKDSQEENTPPLTRREMKYLKKSRYGDVANKFNTAYVLKNTKTGQIVEIRAASSFHACNMIGWKPNRVRILSEKKIEDTPKA